MGNFILGSLCFIGGFIAAAFLTGFTKEAIKQANDEEWPRL